MMFFKLFVYKGCKKLPNQTKLLRILFSRIEDFLDAKEVDERLKTSKGTITYDELFKELGD